MQLERRGVSSSDPTRGWSRSAADGRALVFSTDIRRTAEAIRPFSAKDAGRYPEFCATLARLGGFLEGLLEMTPPSIDAPSAGELWELMKTGRRFRALGKKDAFALLRWGPMAVADLVGRMVRVGSAAGRDCGARHSRHGDGTVVGRHRRGAAARRRQRSAAGRQQHHRGRRAWRRDARDGRGRASRPGRKSAPAARYERILVKDGAATGVVLADGSEVAR